MIRTSFLISASCLGVALGCGGLGCGGPGARSQESIHSDGVPANSLSEKRLEGDGKKPDEASAKKKKDDDRPSAGTTTGSGDPTGPLLTPTANGGEDQSGTGKGGAGGAGTGGTGGTSPASPPTKTGKVTKAECAQLFDKYIELAIGGDSRLEGIPPELIQTAKAQARQQKGDPCETQVVPRAKYNCAIAASTTKAWEKCMK